MKIRGSHINASKLDGLVIYWMRGWYRPGSRKNFRQFRLAVRGQVDNDKNRRRKFSRQFGNDLQKRLDPSAGGSHYYDIVSRHKRLNSTLPLLEFNTTNPSRSFLLCKSTTKIAGRPFIFFKLIP